MDSTIDNLKLFEKKFAILNEISSAIVVTDNVNAIANLMLDLAISYTQAEKGSFMLLNDHSELSISAARGIELQLMRTYRVRLGEGVAGTVARSLTPLLVEDIRKDARFKTLARKRYRTGSFISCPIVSRGKLLGVLNISDKQDNSPFIEDELALIKILANQAAIALENALLVNQLRVKASELEGINRKLIEGDVAKTEFITRVSHELRTPLNSIKGSIFYLQSSERLTPREQKEFYEIITHETDKLIGIVENQLDFLRLEDEAMGLNNTVFNLRELLQEVAVSKALTTLSARRSISFSFTIGDDVSEVVGDKVRVVQFFVNVIEGLSHFLTTNDRVEITAAENGAVEVMVHLSRHLPDTVLPYLFSSNHLFQTEQAEEKLKLYLARKIIDLHRWDMTAENRPDGFLLTVAIPKSSRQRAEAVIDSSMDMFLDFVAELMELNICSVMLSDDLTGELTIRSAKGLEDYLIRQTRLKVGERIAGWVAMEGQPLFIEDIEQDPRFRVKNVAQYNAKSLISVPLKIGERVVGVLNLNNKRSASPFTRQDFDLAILLGERLSGFIARLSDEDGAGNDHRQLLSTFDSLVRAEKGYHKKDALAPYLTTRIMERLGADEEQRKLAMYASLVYDLGLMLFDPSLLQKKGKLLSTEHNSLKVHPHTTVGLLSSFEFSETAKEAILHHHERFDGSGYPDRLKGEEIPLIARVLAVVDSFCALMSKRPYRAPLSESDALAEIRKGSGSAYDPGVVEALGEIMMGDAERQEMRKSSRR